MLHYGIFCRRTGNALNSPSASSTPTSTTCLPQLATMTMTMTSLERSSGQFLRRVVATIVAAPLHHHAAASAARRKAVCANGHFHSSSVQHQHAASTSTYTWWTTSTWLPSHPTRFLNDVGTMRSYTSYRIARCLDHVRHGHEQRLQYNRNQPRREFSSPKGSGVMGGGGGVRFASLLCQHLGISRRQSERMILTERVTLFGKVINSPNYQIYPSNDPHQDGSKAVKVDGKLILGVETTLKRMHDEQQLQQHELQQHDESGDGSSNSHTAKVVSNSASKKENNQLQHEALYSNTRVWLANKLKGELITEVRHTC